MEVPSVPFPHPQDPLGALERDLALQMQIARAAHRLCREENISKQLRRRRKTAALKEEQKLKALEDTLLAERRALSAGGTGGAQGENGRLPSGGEGMCVAAGPQCCATCPPNCSSVWLHPGLPPQGAQSFIPGGCTPAHSLPTGNVPRCASPASEPQNSISGGCTTPTAAPQPSSLCGRPLVDAPQHCTAPPCAPQCSLPGVRTPAWAAPRSHGRAWAGLRGWELPGALL